MHRVVALLFFPLPLLQDVPECHIVQLTTEDFLLGGRFSGLSATCQRTALVIRDSVVETI